MIVLGEMDISNDGVSVLESQRWFILVFARPVLELPSALTVISAGCIVLRAF